jgi:hypothetical protein
LHIRTDERLRIHYGSGSKKVRGLAALTPIPSMTNLGGLSMSQSTSPSIPRPPSTTYLERFRFSLEEHRYNHTWRVVVFDGNDQLLVGDSTITIRRT